VPSSLNTSRKCIDRTTGIVIGSRKEALKMAYSDM
jgi:hypothetical protein